MKSYNELTEKARKYILLNSARHTLLELEKMFDVSKGTIYHFVVTKNNLPYKKSEMNRYHQQEKEFSIDFNKCPITGLCIEVW